MILRPGMLFAKRADRPWACARFILIVSDRATDTSRLLRYIAIAPRRYATTVPLGPRAAFDSDYDEKATLETVWYHSKDVPEWLAGDFVLVGP